MIKSIITTAMALLLVTGAAVGQVKLPPEKATKNTAQNVSVGPCTAIALYPDVEIMLSFCGQLVRVSYNNGTKEVADEYEAVIGQISEGIYRADMADDCWIEVDRYTGVTIVHQYCMSRVFMPKK